MTQRNCSNTTKSIPGNFGFKIPPNYKRKKLDPNCIVLEAQTFYLMRYELNICDIVIHCFKREDNGVSCSDILIQQQTYDFVANRTTAPLK